MFVYHFLHPDLRFEIFFEKEGVADNRDLNFEIEDRGTSAYCDLGAEENLCRACFSLLFFISFQKALDLYFHSYIIEFF